MTAADRVVHDIDLIDAVGGIVCVFVCAPATTSISSTAFA